MLKSPKGSVIEQSIRFAFTALNNESEYKALIVGMKKAKILGVQNLLIHCDSQLLANQLTGECAAMNQIMEAYMRLTQKLFREFKSSYIKRFPRTSNSHAYTLATLASAVDSSLKRTIEVEYLPTPSIETDQGCHVIFYVKTDLGLVGWIRSSDTLKMELFLRIVEKHTELKFKQVIIGCRQTKNSFGDRFLGFI